MGAFSFPMRARLLAGALSACFPWLPGCAGGPSGGAGMATIVESWRGANIDEAKRQWGPPVAVQAHGQSTAYVWVAEVLLAQAPGSGPRDARAPTSPVPPTSGQCRRRLFADASGVISGGDWSGDACCATSRFGQCAALRRKSMASAAPVMG